MNFTLLVAGLINPDIERTYGGGRKPLASRVPLSWGQDTGAQMDNGASETPNRAADLGVIDEVHELHELDTPPATEGSFTTFATDQIDIALGETETEPELPELASADRADAATRKPRSDSSYSASSQPDFSASYSGLKLPAASKSTGTRPRSKTMHDLTHRFFRRPLVVLWRLDLFR